MESSNPKNVPEVLIGAAFQAFFVALFLTIVINLTFSLGFGIFSDMVPDAPPGMAPRAELRWPAQLKNYFEVYSFQVYWGASFVVLVTTNLSRDTKIRPLRRLKVRLRYIGQVIAEKWFSVLVGNAFMCLFAAMIFSVMQQTSPVRWITDAVLTAIHPLVDRIARLMFDADQLGTARAFIDWYHDNEVKFTFWIFYASALLDDFGLPNLKTLVRRVWRRYYPRSSDSHPKPAVEPPPPPSGPASPPPPPKSP